MPYKRKQKGLTRWVGQVQVGGVRKNKIFTTKAEALAWEVQMRSGEGLPPKKLSPETDSDSSISLAQWAEEYLVFAQKFSRKTFSEKQTLFIAFFKEVDPTMLVEDLKAKHVLRFLQKQFDVRGGNAANKDRKNLLAAWNWGARYLDFPEKSPCKVDRFPEIRSPRYIPPEEDFWAAYEVAEGQDKLMLLTFLHLAARRNEIFNLRWDDVDFQNHRVRLWTSKRLGGIKEYDWVAMTDELFESLFRHRQNSQSECVFPNPQSGKAYVSRVHWTKMLCAMANVKAFGIHAIRHLSASILDAAGVELTIIQSILRHKSPSTTARYLHRLRGVKGVVNEVFGQKKKPPRAANSERPKLRVVK